VKSLPAIALAALALTACEAAGPPTAQQAQAQKAEEAAQAVTFEKNAEIDNIQRRLKLTSNPGQIGFILLMNQAGQPILYASVRGKVTSGGKRLTAPVTQYRVDHGNAYGTDLGPGPSDEGTYGTSGEYIYFWTTDGQYYQWAGNYLYSDKPFRTDVKPLVIAVQAEGKP
jgi:hypothetical protein